MEGKVQRREDHARLVLDAGERDDETEELWARADVLAVACGGHAGDAASMRRLADFCRARPRPALGAHPSYPDRAGFGRRSIAMASDVLEARVAEQCAALAAIARDTNTKVRFVKPHGALWHDARAREDVASAVLRGAIAALGRDVVVIGPTDGALRAATAAIGVAYAREGFADRGVRPDGTLVPRGEPGALVTDPATAAARARALATSVEMVCVHGDGPNALAIARAVREALDG